MSNKKEFGLCTNLDTNKQMINHPKAKTYINPGFHQKCDRLGSKTAPIEEEIVRLKYFLLIYH